MIGLFILFALVAYIGLARFIVKRLPNNKTKYIGIAIAVLIPMWDIVPGYLYFYSVCATESGQRIYKTVELPPEYFLHAGEIDQSRRDEWGEYPVAKGGELNFLKLKETYIHTNQHDRNYSRLFHITRVYGSVQDKKTNQIFGDATSFYYSGGWLENTISEFPGHRWCPNAPTDAGYIHATLEEKIFKPMKSFSRKGE